MEQFPKISPREFQTSVTCANFIKIILKMWKCVFMMKTHFQFVCLTGTLFHRKWSETTYLRDRQCKKNLQKFVWCVAAEPQSINRNNNKSRDSSDFYEYSLMVRIESLMSETELSAVKKQIFNVSIEVKFINSCGRS